MTSRIPVPDRLCTAHGTYVCRKFSPYYLWCAFGTPATYTLATLPTPNDSRVLLVTVPEKKKAAMRFSWSRSGARVASKKQELLTALNRDSMPVTGEVQYAGYNAPGTPP